MKREAKMYKGCIVAPGSDLWNMLEERQTPEQVKKVEAHYAAVDLAYRKSHGLLREWKPMDSAPLDSEIRLRGIYPGSDKEVEVLGEYEKAEDGAYTEGWIDHRGNVFYPTQWSPK